MENKLSLAEELKTLYSEAETLKILMKKLNGNSIITLQDKEERERILKYQSLFVKHLMTVAQNFKISNDDVADMLSAQVGGNWQIKCKKDRNVKLYAAFSNLGVASRVIDEEGRKEGEISLCEYWRVTHYKNSCRLQDLTNLNWIVPYFLNLADSENVRENPLNSYDSIVKKNNLYLTIFNLLDNKLKAMVGARSTALKK